MKHRLRPHTSVNFPPGTINAAMTSVNSVIVAWTPETGMANPSAMALMDTVMVVAAKLATNCASANGATPPPRRIFTLSGEAAARLRPPAVPVAGHGRARSAVTVAPGPTPAAHPRRWDGVRVHPPRVSPRRGSPS
nr:hypothetical protein GCM10017745_40750 [Saccharothrix mutabilis subsp. capreolus]